MIMFTLVVGSFLAGSALVDMFNENYVAALVKLLLAAVNFAVYLV